MLFIALSPLFIFLIILLTVAFLDISGVNDIKKKMNELYECHYCELVHRNYQRMLSQIETKCPHCHKEHNNFKKIYSFDKKFKYKYPFALKISLIKAIKIHKAIKNNEKNECLDSQIEKYLRVQEDQLEKMRAKKDEVIKD